MTLHKVAASGWLLNILFVNLALSSVKWKVGEEINCFATGSLLSSGWDGWDGTIVQEGKSHVVLCPC